MQDWGSPPLEGEGVEGGEKDRGCRLAQERGSTCIYNNIVMCIGEGK